MAARSSVVSLAVLAITSDMVSPADEPSGANPLSRKNAMSLTDHDGMPSV